MAGGESVAGAGSDDAAGSAVVRGVAEGEGPYARALAEDGTDDRRLAPAAGDATEGGCVVVAGPAQAATNAIRRPIGIARAMAGRCLAVVGVMRSATERGKVSLLRPRRRSYDRDMGNFGEPGSLPTWGFASPGPLRDEVTALALAGIKTTTAALLVELGLDGEPVPRPGDRALVLDSADLPVALVETVACRVLRLADVDDRHAIDEGEGFANAAEFREAHERSWNGYIETLRERLGDPAFTLSDDTEVAAERFCVVEVVDADGRPFRPRVRPAYPADRAAVDAFLAEHNADVVARRGELVDARRHPVLIVEARGAVEGVLTWILDGSSMEILTLHAGRQWHGTGTALLAAAHRVAEAVGARRQWLITTNDNVDALRFYQRRGFGLSRVHAGAVDRARATLKTAIPEVGFLGIPLRDELELEMVIGGSAEAQPPPDAETLLALELALARRDEAAIPGGYEAVLADDFTEIGAAGRLWTRAEMLALMAGDTRATNAIEDFVINELGAGLVLATYDAVGEAPDGTPLRSRRSSTWIHRDGRWQMRFNQGTPVPPDRE